jgi:metallo-beta-lactamase class B
MRPLMMIALILTSSCDRPAPPETAQPTPAPAGDDGVSVQGSEEEEAWPQRISETLSVRRIEGTSAWIIEHEVPISANSLLYVADDGTPILADTPWTPEATRELLAWIETRFGRLPALATINHYHFDASGGIGALQEAGVLTVASTHTAQLLAERGPGMLRALASSHGEMFEGWPVPSPDETFSPDEGASWVFGGTEVQVQFFGAAHTPDNVVTYFPEAKLLFGGCLVKGGDSLGYLGDADVAAYPDTVRRLQALEPRIVISGHGDRQDSAQLDNTLRLAVAEAGARQDE